MDAVSVLLVIVIGLVAGAVVNALSDDLPRRIRPQLPHYPDGEPRPVTAWLGVTAFLTGQRRSSGGSALSWRHPVTEIALVLLMLLTVSAARQRADYSDLQLVFWLFHVTALVLVTVIDIEHKLILFAVINPFVVVAILDALLTQNNAPPAIVESLIGGLVGYGVFFLLYQGGFLFTRIMSKRRGREIKEVAFGYGDVMLASVVGLLIGWRLFLFSMYITIILGALGALLFIVSRRLLGTRYSAFTALPYGPYIVAGALVMILFPTQVGGLLLGGF
ncbi:MAG: prepilin peptidase [Chloroflexi bacterium]|nr:prepilin peptidase [Chloroflexota bacterium]